MWILSISLTNIRCPSLFLRSQIKKTVGILAGEKIDRLDALWRSLFEQHIGEEHLKSLVEHVDAFFEEVIGETESRRTGILKKIEGELDTVLEFSVRHYSLRLQILHTSGLNQEKTELQRLLKEDIEDVDTTNVPLHTLQMNIDESLKNLRMKLDARLKEIDELKSEQDQLCAELEERPRSLVADPLPSEAELQVFRDYLDKLRDEKYNRFGRILELRDRIKALLKSLEITNLSEYDDNLINSTELKPTSHNIEKIEQLLENCNDQYERMDYQMKDMRKRLAQLWKYLDVSESHQQKYEKYSDVTQSNYDKMTHEVQRCEKIKRENIKVFIERVRVEIEEYWDLCLKSDAERMRFPSYTSNIFNEDVLELHEDELRDLKTFYENNEPIFKLIKERNDLWSQLEVLQNKEQDPKRYNNRGGQLLKEEKERKMLMSKLPKIEDRLIQACDAYEQETNRPFTVKGVRVQDLIDKEYEAKRQEKITKSGKKVQATPLKTPSRGNLTSLRTPLTVEQTIINRTGLKTTGGRLRPAISKATLCTTASSTSSAASTVYTENGKRRMVVPKTTGPQAKRQLLGAFVSPNKLPISLSSCRAALRAKNDQSHTSQTRGANRKPTIRVYNTGSLIKRKSLSRKSISKKRRSSMLKKSKAPIPEIVLSEHEDGENFGMEDVPENATSYEGFEVSLQHALTSNFQHFFNKVHFLVVRFVQQEGDAIIGDKQSKAATLSRCQSLWFRVAHHQEGGGNAKACNGNSIVVDAHAEGNSAEGA